MVYSIEDSSLQNVYNHIFLRRSQILILYENALKSIDKSTKYKELLALFLESQSLMNLPLNRIFLLYSRIILWEFNYFIILRLIIFRFVLYFWSPRYFQLCLINKLSKVSFIIFRVYFRLGFELAQHKFQHFSSLLIKFYY